MPSGAGDALSVDDHLARAARHRVIGDLIFEARDEWAAVPLFYSAYHFARAALLRDPIFDDPNRCAAKNTYLTMEDRQCSRHSSQWKYDNAGQRFKAWGLNDLIGMLYPDVWPEYMLMHQASVQVRYQKGLVLPLAKIHDSLDLIASHSEQGLLVAA